MSAIYELDIVLNDHLRPALSAWLHPVLVRIHGANWWRAGVVENLTEVQRSGVSDLNREDLDQLDLQALLHTAVKNYGDYARMCRNDWSLRTPLQTVRDARNAIAHRRGTDTITDEDLLLYALNASKALKLVGAPDESVATAQALIKKLSVAAPSSADRTSEAPTQFTVDHPVTTETTDADGPSVHDRSADDTSPQWLTLVQEGHNAVLRVTILPPTSGENPERALPVRYLTDHGTRDTRLSVPPYLTSTARAVAAILATRADAGLPETIPASLHRVEFFEGKLAFPDSPVDDGGVPPLVVLFPNYLVNVTSLTHFDYCPRNYLIDRYTLSKPGLPTMRGTVVHDVFETMLRQPDDPNAIMNGCAASIERQIPQLAMQGIAPGTLYDDARHHLNAASRGVAWWKQAHAIAEVFTERYFINPDLGLKGKIDALVHKADGHWQALELKTGKSWGNKINDGHKHQVSAYQLLLRAAGFENLDQPCVVYTGNHAEQLAKRGDELPTPWMFKEVPYTMHDAIEQMSLRNELVRIDMTGQLPFNENNNKCVGCQKTSKATTCASLHRLGFDGGDLPAPSLKPLLGPPLSDEDRALFISYNDALLAEYQAARLRHGEALSQSIESRIVAGSCVEVALTDFDEDSRTAQLRFPTGNASEIREGEPCLMSDAAGPIGGKTMEVWVASIDRQRAVVRVPRGVSELWFAPMYLDTNSPDSAFERNFAALYALWAKDDDQHEVLAPLRDPLLGKPMVCEPNVPRTVIDPYPSTAGPPLLPDQCQALALARGLGQLLLVQGPPGTGKTYTLACLVRSLVEAGRRVMIATYTHRAAEEVLSKLQQVAPEIEVRKLGRVTSTSQRHQSRSLETILAPAPGSTPDVSDKTKLLEHLRGRFDATSSLLAEPCVYVGTVQAWISGNFDQVLPGVGADGTTPFDVAVVDEASQVITPALLGVLRLARRWVLVGDHRQLPPVIIEERAALLKRTLFELLADHFAEDPSTLVRLSVQHRMPPALADFVSDLYYDGRLESAPECGAHRLPSVAGMDWLSPERPVVMVNAIRQGEGHSVRQFPEEAEWIVSRLAGAFRAGLPIMTDDGRPLVGVIAPYRAQVALIRRRAEEILADWGDSGFWEQVIDTVDRFQGDERELVLMSLCLDRRSRKIPLIYADERRLNVALSRARAKLCLVGDLGAVDRIAGLREARQRFMTRPPA